MGYATEITATTMAWINWVLFGVLALLCFSKIIAPTQFSSLVRVFEFDKYLGIYSRSNYPVFNRLNFCFFGIRQAVFSVFLVILFSHFKLISLSPKFFWMFLFFLTAYWGVRFLIERILAYAFYAEKLLYKNLFYRISLRNLFAVILLVSLCLAVYIPHYKVPFLYILSFLYCLMQIGLLSAIIYKNRSLIKKHYLYFILYICGFEIIPLLILIKVFIEGKTTIL